MADEAENTSQQELITEETTVSTKEMAILLNITVRRVQQLIQDGTFPTKERGRLILIECTRAYYDLITSREKTADEKKIDKVRSQAEAKLKVAKAAMAELQAKELQGKMHRSEDVQLFTQGLIDAVKSSLLSLPGRLAVEVSLCGTAEEASLLIKEAVKDILREVSEFDYDPDKYEELVRERQNMDERQDDDE